MFIHVCLKYIGEHNAQPPAVAPHPCGLLTLSLFCWIVVRKVWRKPAILYQMCSSCTKVSQCVDWEGVSFSAEKHSYSDALWIRLLAILVSDKRRRTFLVWQIWSRRERGKIWLQCFGSFLQWVLYFGILTSNLSFLIISPSGFGVMGPLKQTKMVLAFSEGNHPLSFFLYIVIIFLYRFLLNSHGIAI